MKFKTTEEYDSASAAMEGYTSAPVGFVLLGLLSLYTFIYYIKKLYKRCKK